MCEKLDKLASFEGYETAEDLLEAVALSSVVPGICTYCDFTTDVEPDQDRGFCEMCGTNSVKSALILAGII